MMMEISLSQRFSRWLVGSSIYKVSRCSDQKSVSLFPILRCESNGAFPPSRISPSKSWSWLCYQYPGRPFSPQSLRSPTHVKLLGSSTSWLPSRLILFLSVSLSKKKKGIWEQLDLKQDEIKLLYNQVWLFISLDCSYHSPDTNSLVNTVTPNTALHLGENRISFIITFYFSICRNALQ